MNVALSALLLGAGLASFGVALAVGGTTPVFVPVVLVWVGMALAYLAGVHDRREWSR